MSTTYVDEYLVKLGSAVDQSGMQRFYQALREASSVADASAASIAGSFFKAQTEIVGGFAAIGAAAVGLADKVAMADQSYRLFALHMHLGLADARALKITTDALGASLGEIWYDPELRARSQQLIQDQLAMAPGQDFEARMQQIRDIRFEFTRMEVELQYLSMHVVSDFLHALGTGPEDLLARLREFNHWATTSLPEISQKIVHDFLPIWKDVEAVLGSVFQTGVDVAQVFTNIISLISGDEAIGGAVTFEKFAHAVEKVVHWMALLSEFISKIAATLSGLLVGGTVGGLIGAVVGGVAGIPLGPAGVIAGVAGGAATGAAWGGGVLGLGGAAFDLERHLQPGGTGGGSAAASGSPDIHALVDKYALLNGVDPALAHALAMVESGERQYDASGAVIQSGTGPSGALQLSHATARALGVDPNDPDQNVQGGMVLLSHLMQKYGNRDDAVLAYHDGEAKMDAYLAGKATISPEARQELARVNQTLQIGSINVHVANPNATNEHVAQVVADRIRATQNKRVQRNIAEFQDLSPGY